MLKNVVDNFGRIKIFNLLELLPFLSALGWSGWCLWYSVFTSVTVGILIVGCFVSAYLMFLRMISFVVGVTMMVGAFMPLLKQLKENER